MALSYDLLSQFAKITKDETKTKKESSTYGTIVKYNNAHYVKLDGSDLLTPYTTTVSVEDGDRVVVTIKNHSATVTGSTNNPSASNSNVVSIGNKVDKFEIIVADKVTAQDIEAVNGYFETIKAISGSYEELSAITAEIETLQAKYANMEHITATDAEILNAEIESLKSRFGEFTSITTEDLEAVNAEFSNITAYNANFTYVSTDVLKAMKADIKELNTTKLDAETANIKYANIDFSNIKEAAIEKLFSDSGIIKDLIMSDGKVTGELVGVTIKGDLIEGNTVKADKLVVLGEDGLYYKLNVNSLGEATASADEKYQNGLDGSVLVANSVTAEKVTVDDLVAFGATIGGFHIGAHSLYSGVKESVSNTTEGIFLGDDGQVAIGNADNYLKFYIGEDGTYKLELQASSLKFNTSGTTVEDAINNLNTDIENVNSNMQEIKNEYDSIIKSTFESTDEGYQMKFTELFERITSVDGTVNRNYEELVKYIQFNNGTIILTSYDEKTIAIQSDTAPDDSSYMWYDTTSSQLKKYYNNEWATVSKSNTAPGDTTCIWYDTTSNQLNVHDGTNWVLLESIPDIAIQSDTAPEDTSYIWYDTTISKYKTYNGTDWLTNEEKELKVSLSTGKMSFLENDVEVAYISNNRLYVYDGEFLNSLTIGRWVWIVETDGGLSLNYV